MTRQLLKPVAVPLGWILCGAINGAIYGGGWLCMRWDDAWAWFGRVWTRPLDEYRARRVGAKTEAWLRDGER